MHIIKLGGSLTKAHTLPACLHTLAESPPSELRVIVPGGGAFADQVRETQRVWQFDDTAAHAMAILAMQQMALLFHALYPQAVILERVADIAADVHCAKTVIWSPQLSELNAAGVAASWQITSDSLAAWLANQLNANRLLLVKSAAVAGTATLTELAAAGIVDAAFPRFADPSRYAIQIICHTELAACLP